MKVNVKTVERKKEKGEEFSIRVVIQTDGPHFRSSLRTYRSWCLGACESCQLFVFRSTLPWRRTCFRDVTL